MSIAISVQVPTSESDSLIALGQELGEEVGANELQPFDGEAFAQMLLLLSPTSIPVLRIWLNARVQQRKRFRVVYQGTEWEGYTAAEVEKLIRVLRDDATDE